ncbi:MAG: conjugal transfer protein TraF [Candidatus Methylumidiphilus sp.]
MVRRTTWKWNWKGRPPEVDGVQLRGFQCVGFALCLHAGTGFPAPPVPAAWFSASVDRQASELSNPDAGYFGDKERGWFWYEHDPVPEATPELAPPKPVPQAEEKPQPAKPKEPAPLSAEWMRKNIEKYRDKAVDDPTKENVAAYAYLQRVMLDKAERFTNAFQGVVMNDPVLDENTRRPIATFGANAKDEIAQQSKSDTMKKLAGMAGLWFFYESTCKFCVKQAEVLKGLQATHGFSILPVAVDGMPLPGSPFKDYMADNGQARQLGVNMTPAIYLVKPGAGGSAIQLGQGLFAMGDIVERALYLAHEKHWIDTAEFDGTRAVTPLLVDSGLGNQMGQADLSDTAKMAGMIRANLKPKQH